MTTIDKSMISGARATLAEKNAEAERIASTFKVDDQGRFTISTEQHQAYVSAVEAGKEAKSFLDAVEAQESHAAYLNGSDDASVAGQHYGQPNAQVEGKSLGSDFASVFVDSDAYKAAREAGFNRGAVAIHAEAEGKSIYNFSGGTVTVQATGPAENLGILEGAKRKTHIRDLFPQMSTSASVLYGVRETGWVNNAKQVNQKYAADGVSAATGNDATDVWGRAPKSNITLSPVMYPVAAVRHALDAHKDILSDEPRLRSFLNMRMVDGVKYAEDYALLHSVGSGEQITGLYNVSGVQQYTGLPTDNYSVQVRRAITKAVLAEYDPTGLVISPTRWEQIEVEMDKQGQFRVAVSVSIGGVKQVWRLNVVETTAMDDTNFVIGAFGMGAQLYDREQVSVSVSSEHASNFTDGIVTFLGEERIAFEVPRPESFVIGSWTTPGVNAPGTN